MVVPLKLTQFYGHKVPRPRVYPDVKFNDQRVDPPASVHEALLTWAADAHWSMGGLSFKRLRTQGKVEGNVRRLRAMLEEEEGKDRKVSSIRKGTDDSHAVTDRKSAAKRQAAGTARERRNKDEEMVEATPPRKQRSRDVVKESSVEMPLDTPSSEERMPTSAKLKSKSGLNERSANDRTKKRQQQLSPESVVVETPTIVRAKADRKRKADRAIETAEAEKRTKVSSFLASIGDDDGRLTRSAKKASADQDTSHLQTKKTKSRARKALMVSDSESSESDDGLEEFLREKSRPLRRSSRLVKTENTFLESADQDSD